MVVEKLPERGLGAVVVPVVLEMDEDASEGMRLFALVTDGQRFLPVLS